jgi:hypothetical protein
MSGDGPRTSGQLTPRHPTDSSNVIFS